MAKRDKAADRSLFERALDRLDEEAEAKRRGDDDQDRSPQRRARFDKRLARGEIEPAATLDLHGMDREQATTALRRFLATAPGEAVLIIHGRGLRILEAAAIAELDRHPRVAEHVSAPRSLGGHGARLVRLR
jgi:DNA-nicking Smr family endonuclease